MPLRISQPTTHNPQSTIGFTLIEVVLVAALLALLLAGALPRFQATAQRLRAERAAFELAQLCRYAHERAVAQGDVIVLSWDAQGRRARLGSIAGQNPREWPADCTGEPAPLSPALESAVVPDVIAVQVVRDEQEVSCVHFFPDGTSDPTTFHLLQRGSAGYTITVDEPTSQVLLFPRSAAR
ncbi:MAG: hypothetical protein HYS71_03270 [Candidatus Omnitrophica bacterium]|nr:hypothetical protein [Candidatus Omnitrophota bacterium]